MRTRRCRRRAHANFRATLPSGTLRSKNRSARKRQPVLLVEGESASRKALYAAYEVHGSQMTPLFFFEADGYAVQPDRSLLVTNPAGVGEDGSASASQDAVYTRQGDSYQFAGFQRITPTSTEPICLRIRTKSKLRLLYRLRRRRPGAGAGGGFLHQAARRLHV